MQSRYAAQPGTQMSAEMAWGGQRAQNKCSIRMRYWIRPDTVGAISIPDTKY